MPIGALWSCLLWVAKQLNFLVLLSAALLFVVDLVQPARGCGRSLGAVRNDVINVVKAIEQFQLQHEDRCPGDLDELKAARVLSRIPKDPWGRPFVIECSEAKIRVCSRGADEADPEDDVCVEEHPYQPTPAGEPGVAIAPTLPVPTDALLMWPVVEMQEGAEVLQHPHALKALDFVTGA